MPCSMAKLFDLMAMTVKLQLAVAVEPDAPFTVALRHLGHVRDLLERSPTSDAEDGATAHPAIPRLDAFRSKLCVAFQNATRATWLSVRAQLLGFFEGRHTRVRPHAAHCGPGLRARHPTCRRRDP